MSNLDTKKDSYIIYIEQDMHNWDRKDYNLMNKSLIVIEVI